MLKIFYVILFILITQNSKGDVIITNSSTKTVIGKHISVFNDGKEHSIDEVIRSDKFIPYNNDVPNLGMSSSSVWLRFTITNRSSDSLLLEVAYPILDEVELFSPERDNQYSSILLGEKVNFDKRKYNYPNYIFDLKIPQNSSRTYYLRVKNAEPIILPVSVNHPTSLWENINKENLITGIYLGIILIMFFYNLFIYFAVRDKSYLYYVVFVIFGGLTQIGIKGYNFQYLWPNSPAFELKSVVMFANIAGMSTLLFTRNFLRTKENAPVLNIVISICIGVFCIGLFLTIIGWLSPAFQVMQSITSISTITIFTVSYRIMRAGYTPAKFFFAAWIILIIGVVIFLLKDYHVLPYNTFTSYSVMAASAVEMSLLSFGLANRINILRQEKEASQAEALYAAEENARIIREQNVILEAKVDERTTELKASNSELQKTLVDLKETESQLVESEKMASLGQLTAGIAHEINNPINFITSNVNPLKRDVDILLEAINRIESVGLSDEVSDDKQKQIENYKEEIDFDYLKVEINHLLQGINDGASRTAEIVKGLRIFSRLDEDDLKKADINECLDSTLIIVNNLFNKIKLEKKYEEIPLIECYPGKLNQVFLNIISNAIYAINKQHGDQPGGILKISTSSNETCVFVKIEDNGTGMDENTKKKIFEPFFTTKDVGEGTGLGMSITYNTIKRHNGQILINSKVGVGSEFILELPIIHEITVN
jgi:signal transduction histidine kinase